MHAPCASDRSASLQHCVSTWRPRHTNHSFVAGATAPSRSNMIWMLTTAQSTKTPTHARNARRHTLLEGSILWRKARWIRLSIHLVSGFLAKSSMERRALALFSASHVRNPGSRRMRSKRTSRGARTVRWKSFRYTCGRTFVQENIKAMMIMKMMRPTSRTTSNVARHAGVECAPDVAALADSSFDEPFYRSQILAMIDGLRCCLLVAC